ncbi:phosphatases II [Ganoderma leucocontextum]|nr:phosphatases II [Ganoderma leucocontextum]
MVDYIRRLVSGNKARHKDNELDLELDLAYITDHVIVMGYPASGVEGLYRNRREDAKKFLEHHHGKNYWVFNFCPVKENAYPASVFDGRVSRYPFPDHHAPPLAILPLAAREIRLWLDGSPERVAVLHCKAGKGRSGTMACAYMLTLDVAPNAPSLIRSFTEKEKAKSRAEQVMNAMPVDETAAEVIGTTTRLAEGEGGDESEDLVKLELADGDCDGHSDSRGQPAAESGPQPSKKHKLNSLSHVLDLHTARRMKRPPSASATLKQGVSIPSQRRWLYYWSLVLARQAPPDFWPVSVDLAMDPVGVRRACPTPKVRLTQIRLRMRELGGLKTNLVRATNALLEGVGKKIDAKGRNSSQMWASLARYDDEFVDTLEEWERYTRDQSGTMGVRRKGANDMGGEAIMDLFEDDRWDSKKMVQSFARMSTVKDEDIRKEASDEGGKVETFLLRTLTGDKWQRIRAKIEADGQAQQTETVDNQVAPTLTVGLESETEDGSLYDVTQTLSTDGGVVLDAHREVRVKLYLGQMFMGWFWFIPTFHMHHPKGEPAAGERQHATTFTLKRKELDFPIGLGANVIDVALSMEWCAAAAADVATPGERDVGPDAREGKDEVAATLTAVTAGETGEIVHAKQAAED